MAKSPSMRSVQKTVRAAKSKSVPQMTQSDPTSLEPESPRPDLYIALVAPTGTPLDDVKTNLRASLASFGYEYVPIKISQLIAEKFNLKTSGWSEERRIRELMRLGDELRRRLDNGAAPMFLAMNRIREIRERFKQSAEGMVQKKAFVIDSLKNPAEVDALDEVYGRNAYVVSIFSERDSRVEKIASKIAESKRRPRRDKDLGEAELIIKDDERRDSSKFSQNVVNTFPKADYFISIHGDVEKQVSRLTSLIFGAPFITPTVSEYGMFLAAAASRRSCDLSRQVGAAILSDDASIIATGCNEVPYQGGGFYFEGRSEASDNRDHVHGHDPNAAEIQRTLEEVIETLVLAGEIKPDGSDEFSASLASELLHGQHKDKMSGSRIRSIIEYGRVVHAEMHAITEAARNGRAVKGSTLFCTTYPCHICARHIISSGISSVVYIEPYPKSMTPLLYAGEISPSASEKGDDRVQFVPFFGVAPKLYLRLFAHRPGKTELGVKINFDRLKAIPVGAVPLVSRFQLELAYSALTAESDSGTSQGPKI